MCYHVYGAVFPDLHSNRVSFSLYYQSVGASVSSCLITTLWCEARVYIRPHPDGFSLGCTYSMSRTRARERALERTRHVAGYVVGKLGMLIDQKYLV